MDDFLLEPPVPEDIGSARCVVSSEIMRKRNLLIGQWVRIDSVSEVCNFIFFFVFTAFYTITYFVII